MDIRTKKRVLLAYDLAFVDALTELADEKGFLKTGAGLQPLETVVEARRSLANYRPDKHVVDEVRNHVG